MYYYIMSKYEELMDKHSDHRVKNWLFMDGISPTLYILAAYFALVLYILPSYMKNRKPVDITTIIRMYNISQVVICTLLVLMVSTSGWIQGEYSFGCQTIDYSNTPHALTIARAFHFVYLLKIYELVETIFFILRKKSNQVSALHVYHHASTLFLSFIGCKFIAGGMFALPVMVNLIIHMFMYTYYYLSSFGEKWQAKLTAWKPKLTIAQMVQFTFMIGHSMTAFQPGCEVPKQFFFLYLPNVFLLYKMFLDFYRRSYKYKEKN